MESCLELPDMQLEPVRSQALAVRMDVVEAEYKARIEELEKRDPTEQLKVAAKEITGQIVQ